MASPSHTVMLREISAAGDRESTGALDLAWGRAHASLFFKFGHPRHLLLTTADGRMLAGKDALTALLAELPADIEVATWRRAMVTEETLDLTADELIALLDPHGSARSNGSAGSPNGREPGLPQPGSAPAPPRPVFGRAHFPLLPLGPVLWSDAMANVLDLEAMLPLLPNCLLVLTLPEPQAAALVAEGVITDAVWMTEGQGLLGDTAARALMRSREGELTAYRIDDPRMSTVLRTLLGDPGALVSMAGEVDALSAPEPAAEPAAPAEEAGGAAGLTAQETPPTFDMAFAYVGLSGRDNDEPSTAHASPATSTDVPAQPQTSTRSARDAVTPPSAAPALPVDRVQVETSVPAQPHMQSGFGAVGLYRSSLQVPVRVLASLGLYALSWRKNNNLELQRFDPKLPAPQARSTPSSVLAWLTALLITVAGAVLFASTRQSIHLPFGRQLTSTEAYYLIGGLAFLYLIVIVPFNVAAAKADLRRLRLIQEHVGISDRQQLRLGSARLMVIPVIGRLVLLGLEQAGINAIWNAATIANAPGAAAAEAAVAEPPISVKAAADSPTAPVSKEAVAAANSDELGAIFSELQAQPVWFRIAAPKPEEAAQPEATADRESRSDALVTDDPEASIDNPADPGGPAPPCAPDESVDSASPVLTSRADPVWFHNPTPPAQDTVVPPEVAAGAGATNGTAAADVIAVPATIVIVEAGPTLDGQSNVDAPAAPAVESASTGAASEFVPPRLDIDVDALRHGLTDIAVKWLGADEVAPVAAVIAAARPGVDDFVAAIVAIRVMEIPGRESPIVRAMAREMHYYATEILCGV
jgi:hypothetical protein